MLEKLKSRKFLMALLSVVLGVLSLFGVADGTVEIASSIGLILVPTIVYIVTEGKIDAAAIGKIIDSADEILDIITGEEEVEGGE